MDCRVKPGNDGGESVQANWKMPSTTLADFEGAGIPKSVFL
jgi:hypothetical protein